MAEKRFSVWWMEFLHPAMWHAALESWQWIHQVAAPCNIIRGSGTTCHWIGQTSAILEFYFWFRFWPYHHNRHVILHQCKILSKSDHPRQKKMSSCRFSRWQTSAILDFRCPIMGSSKSLCTTSYRSSIETIAPNCLVFKRLTLL